METWFLLATASAFVGGFYAFLHKIVAQRDLPIKIITFLGTLISACLLFTAAIFQGDWNSFLDAALLFAVGGGVIFSFTYVLKVEALKSIDTAIFFPLYKVASPLFVITTGVLFFQEMFTALEWIGLAASMLVPIMLVTKAEHARQNNMQRGIVLLLVCALITTLAAAFTKIGTSQTANILLYIFVFELFICLGAFLLLVRQYPRTVFQQIKISLKNKQVIHLIILTGGLSALSAFAGIGALYFGGPLSIVYTINSLYILIPIVLSIIFYNEHWNLRKVIAIVLSIAALGLLG